MQEMGLYIIHAIAIQKLWGPSWHLWKRGCEV